MKKIAEFFGGPGDGLQLGFIAIPIEYRLPIEPSRWISPEDLGKPHHLYRLDNTNAGNRYIFVFVKTIR